MKFGPILTNLELFIGWVSEKAKTININKIIKIPFFPDSQAPDSIDIVQLYNKP
jgi:hypothetical protein